jgi:extracellular factor (EF) 3-hydroxypalmitic acid methyl ester biosynthesis protein
MGTHNGSGANGTNGQVKDTLVVGQTSQGAELHATLLRFTRFLAVFEIYSPAIVLRTSEVITDFKIVVRDRAIYSGRAVVRNLVNSGITVVCEVVLNESAWMDVDFAPASGEWSKLREEYREFMQGWEALYKVFPEFKVVVADMQTYLTDLRLWLNQFELGVRSSPSDNRVELENQVAEQLGKSIVPTFDAMHEQLEILSEKIDPDLRPIHQNFAKRQLHPLMLCSPFAHRTYHKPLGYAGDYEMVNMIARNPFEGGSLFAKIVNLWFLSQWPAKAHRNRLSYLAGSLQKETLRVVNASHRKARVLNFACGPAIEIQHFLRDSRLSDCVDLTLLDFNEETLVHTRQVLADMARQFNRSITVQFQKKSVHQVLKDSHKPVFIGANLKQQYDLIYCAGLFDYLSDRTCRQLMDIFYNQLAPGGTLLVTAVDDFKPFRHMLEFVLDWHLIYRNGQKVMKLLPEKIHADEARLVKDSTGVNVFLELTNTSPCPVSS